VSSAPTTANRPRDQDEHRHHALQAGDGEECCLDAVAAASQADASSPAASPSTAGSPRAWEQAPVSEKQPSHEHVGPAVELKEVSNETSRSDQRAKKNEARTTRLTRRAYINQATPIATASREVAKTGPGTFPT